MSSCFAALPRTLRNAPKILRPIIVASIGVVMSITMLDIPSVSAQRIRLPTSQYPDPYSSPTVTFPGTYSADPYTGGVRSTPWVPTSPQSPGAILSGQVLPFDPYSLPSQSAPPPFGGGLQVPPAVPQVFPPPTGYPQGSIPRVVVPSVQTPAYPSGFGGFPPPTNTVPTLPSQPGSIYGPDWGQGYTSPLFPNGLPWNQTGGPYQRLFQDTGARYTYLWGGKQEDSLEIHEVELSTSLVFQNFARSATGLRVTPGFIFDFLDGPSNGSDLPARVYSAYVDGAWRPQITPNFAADLSVRPGIYTDFQSVTGHSLRITGHGIGVIQLTPTTAIKLGAEYLDRANIKILPAGGIYWEPNPQTRFDLYFPRPKIARYWTTVGNNEVWWHIGAEYGGGSWVINRVDAPLLGKSDRVDINDIRVFAGIDWSYLDQRTGFLQIGYVFDREVTYKLVPAENVSLDDTFMVRGGLRF